MPPVGFSIPEGSFILCTLAYRVPGRCGSSASEVTETGSPFARRCQLAPPLVVAKMVLPTTAYSVRGFAGSIASASMESPQHPKTEAAASAELPVARHVLPLFVDL